MKIKIPLGITIGLMAITAAVTFIITSNVTLEMFNNKIKSVNEKQEFYSKLSEIDTYSRTHFIDEIDEDRLIEGMVSGYIRGLGDGYAEYLSAEEYARRQSVQTGVTVGMGFSFEKEASGYIRITEVIPDSPAAKAGLLSGDIITAVNNTDVIAFEGGYDAAIKVFSAEEGTRLKLYVKRSSKDGSDFITYDVISERSEITTVSGRVIDDLGYIRIMSFNDKTEAQLKKKLDEVISAGVKGLVFDLRGNTGGSLSSLEKSLDHILGAGDIVTASYADGNVKTVVSCTEAEEIKMHMSVIVNNTTAGTAELFAFALSDNASARTIGKTTAGKGHLQDAYTCSDGSVVMISTAILSTQNSGDFNKVGLKPEFDVTLPDGVDINNLSDEAARLTDTQLIKAMEVTAPDDEG